MKVEVHFHSFSTSSVGSAREKAAKWMEEQYEKIRQ